MTKKKILKITSRLVLISMGLSTALAAPMIPVEMKYNGSYQTYAFETADGDLELNQYSYTDNHEKYKLPNGTIPQYKYFVRKVPKGEGAWVDSYDPADIAGKTFVPIRCEGCQYYAEFENFEGKRVNAKIGSTDYEPLKTVPRYPHPQKTEFVSALDFNKASAALAITATSTGGIVDTTSVASRSWSHTTSGTNIVLGVATYLLSAQAVDTVTYNAATMSLSVISSNGTAGREASIYYLGDAASGANNVVITPTASTRVAGFSISFSGANTVSPIGTAISFEVNDDPLARQYTTRSANSITFDTVYTGSGSDVWTNDGTQTTQFIDNATFDDNLAAGTQSTASIGTYNSSWDHSVGVSETAYAIAEFKVASTTASTGDSGEGEYFMPLIRLLSNKVYANE